MTTTRVIDDPLSETEIRRLQQQYRERHGQRPEVPPFSLEEWRV